jgi:uncharacterized membrane protein YebE (DUF533 family)
LWVEVVAAECGAHPLLGTSAPAPASAAAVAVTVAVCAVALNAAHHFTEQTEGEAAFPAEALQKEDEQNEEAKVVVVTMVIAAHMVLPPVFVLCEVSTLNASYV